MQSTKQGQKAQHQDEIAAGASGEPQPNKGIAACSRHEHLTLDFRKAGLETVLSHLQDATGLILHIESSDLIERTVDLWHNGPVTTAEALSLLKGSLCQIGCTLIQKGRVFSLIGTEDVKKHCIPLPAI